LVGVRGVKGEWRVEGVWLGEGEWVSTRRQGEIDLGDIVPIDVGCLWSVLFGLGGLGLLEKEGKDALGC